MKYKRLIIIISIVAFLLLIPFMAMQFTNEVQWTLFDFVVVTILLLGAGLAIEIIMRKVKTSKYRIVLSAVVLIMLFIIWAELAVGIFGTPLGGH